MTAADRIYERLLAFANFGFAESHALSFAALVFYSSWLKLYHPAAFCAALLKAQPMGFYSPQSLVADARRHGVTVRRPDINASRAQADLEPGPNGQPAVRLGLAGIRTIGTELAEQIVAARPATGYRSLDELTRTVTMTSAQAEALATAGAARPADRDRGRPAEPTGAARCGRPGRPPVRGPGPWTAAPSASKRRRCPG